MTNPSKWSKPTPTPTPTIKIQKAIVSKVGWAIYNFIWPGSLKIYFTFAPPKRTGKKSIGPRLHVNQQAQAHNELSFDYQNVKAENMMNILHSFTGINTFLIQCCSITFRKHFLIDTAFFCTGSDLISYFLQVVSVFEYMTYRY